MRLSHATARQQAARQPLALCKPPRAHIGCVVGAVVGGWAQRAQLARRPLRHIGAWRQRIVPPCGRGWGRLVARHPCVGRMSCTPAARTAVLLPVWFVQNFQPPSPDCWLVRPQRQEGQPRTGRHVDSVLAGCGAASIQLHHPVACCGAGAVAGDATNPSELQAAVSEDIRGTRWLAEACKAGKVWWPGRQRQQ